MSAHIGTEPGPDFSDPVGLLRACHERVERFAELALTIAGELEEGAPPGEAVQRAAGRVLRYFDDAAPLHHADEETDLLPRLRERLADADAREVPRLMASLSAEHAALAEHWAILRPLLAEIQAGHAMDPAAYRAAAWPFRDLELDHLARENRLLLPAAETHLTDDDRQALGAAMARRRGTGVPP